MIWTASGVTRVSVGMGVMRSRIAARKGYVDAIVNRIGGATELLLFLAARRPIETDQTSLYIGLSLTYMTGVIRENRNWLI